MIIFLLLDMLFFIVDCFMNTCIETATTKVKLKVKVELSHQHRL